MIVSTTLAGPDCLNTIRMAIGSVRPHVSECLVVVDPDIPGASDIVAVASQATGSAPVTPVWWKWQHDYAAARNRALDAAAASGAQWVLSVDADERIKDAKKIAEFMSKPAPANVNAVYIADGRGIYWQARLVRLPCLARWRGRVHEYIELPGRGVEFPNTRFEERVKTAEQLRLRGERDEAALREMVLETGESRWLYYLAEALVVQGKFAEAIEAFLLRANREDGMPEERAVACARGAYVMSVTAGDHSAAVQLCAMGLAHCPGMADLPYQAAMALTRAGRHGEALRWARLALVHVRGGPDQGAGLAQRLLPVMPEIADGRAQRALVKHLRGELKLARRKPAG